ncbi:Hypothetical predicted protein [Xyrichtys novacula]|uniref:Uncharacterized protein n=1 Tax=Xyrichtys novacula TaxID=13765 RepID=A0AAV1H148_XYRNO|nr:Hypothetical predicted protein [Xyrichtys novacula]
MLMELIYPCAPVLEPARLAEKHHHDPRTCTLALADGSGGRQLSRSFSSSSSSSPAAATNSGFLVHIGAVKPQSTRRQSAEENTAAACHEVSPSGATAASPHSCYWRRRRGESRFDALSLDERAVHPRLRGCATPRALSMNGRVFAHSWKEPEGSREQQLHLKGGSGRRRKVKQSSSGYTKRLSTPRKEIFGGISPTVGGNAAEVIWL